VFWWCDAAAARTPAANLAPRRPAALLPAGVQAASAATDLLELTEENVEKVLDEVSSVVRMRGCAAAQQRFRF
jgi:hypothetical protein